MAQEDKSVSSKSASKPAAKAGSTAPRKPAAKASVDKAGEKTAAAKPAAKKTSTETAKAVKAPPREKAAPRKAPAKSEKPLKADASQVPAPRLVEKPSAPSAEERQRWIATAAYHRAEKRGFAPGYAMQDWLDAEAEIDALIGKG